MFFLYQIIVSILIIISPIIIIYRLIKKKEDFTRFKEKFSFPTKKRIKGKLIWFHGASIGEIMSIIPLIKNYEKKRSIKQILLTSSTLSSSKIIKKFKFKKTIHQFYPVDHFFFTNNFINHWKPSIAIFIESEIWPCMFKNLNDKGIQLILLNARLTKKTFDKWMNIKGFARNIFNNISIAYPQNLETLSFLKQMNLRKINPIGNLKFAENYDEKLNNISGELKNQLKRKKIWVASSTHKNEELFCARTHIILKKKIKNLLSIIIPRHVHRTKKIINEIKKLNLNVVTHSSKPKNLKEVDIYIVDTFGETKKFHKLGSSVFLGGSIVERGGQNPLEAARLGSKIFHGPNINNFKDIYKLLKSLKISKKVNSSKQLSSLVIFKKNKNQGVKIKNIGEKILKKTIKELDYLINNEIKKT
tara:strand:+ start:965 stop:2215 length:1251 start_codon:yes stop_codon:yes gene_type:complete